MKPAGEETNLNRNQDRGALTRADIDLKALAHNYGELRRVTAPEADTMAVVKADGYGHGAPRVAKVALDCGAKFLAVARLEEAIRLRQAGIDAPILLFGFSFPADVAYMASHDIWASVNTLKSGQILSGAACQAGVTLKAHIKVDTGMGRLGLLHDDLEAGTSSFDNKEHIAAKVLRITQLPGLEVEGIYTHFARADEKDKSHTLKQFARFMALLDILEKKGFAVPFRHAANSAATIEMPETHLDLVRPGVSQYGLWPSGETDRNRVDLKPVMTVISTVIQVKSVGKGFTVSYGGTYRTKQPTAIATVPIGYADGFNRILSSNGHMLVHGIKVPIIGRVCMDLTMIDVGDVPEVTAGDEVIVLGRQGSNEITADDIANRVGTINYEIVSSLMPRVERIYIT